MRPHKGRRHTRTPKIITTIGRHKSAARISRHARLTGAFRVLLEEKIIIMLKNRSAEKIIVTMCRGRRWTTIQCVLQYCIKRNNQFLFKKKIVSFILSSLHAAFTYYYTRIVIGRACVHIVCILRVSVVQRLKCYNVRDASVDDEKKILKYNVQQFTHGRSQ